MLRIGRCLLSVFTSLILVVGCTPSAEKTVYTIKGEKIKIEYTNFYVPKRVETVETDEKSFLDILNNPDKETKHLIEQFENLEKNGVYQPFLVPFIGMSKITHASGGMWEENKHIHGIVVGEIAYSALDVVYQGEALKLVFLLKDEERTWYEVTGGDQKLNAIIKREFQQQIKDHLLFIFKHGLDHAISPQEAKEVCNALSLHAPSTCEDTSSYFLLLREILQKNCSQEGLLALGLYSLALHFPLDEYDCTVSLDEHLLRSIESENYMVYALAPGDELVIETRAPMPDSSQSIYAEYHNVLSEKVISEKRRHLIESTF